MLLTLLIQRIVGKQRICWTNWPHWHPLRVQKVLGTVTQKLDAPIKATYFGKGKLEELLRLKETLGYDTVIVDDELRPQQQQYLEDLLKVKVIDRVALILDIFARRARTHEGKLQVELAQYEYNLPRLVGKWRHLERLGAGIGTRGPGETQLETDKRIMRQKITRLKKTNRRSASPARIIQTEEKKKRDTCGSLGRLYQYGEKYTTKCFK